MTLIGPWKINVCPKCNGVAPAFMVGYECVSGHKPVVMETVEVEPVNQPPGAVEEIARLKRDLADALSLALTDDPDWTDEHRATLARLTGGQSE